MDECFAGRAPYQRQAYEAMLARLASLGPVHTDVATVGVFLKHDPRIARVLPVSGDRAVHIVKLTSVDDVDGQVRDWLTQACDAASI